MSDPHPSFIGHQPSVSIQMDEREKYRRMWEQPVYRQVAPGEDCVDLFLSVAQPKEGSSLIDFGCGTGRGALKLAQSGLCVTALDFAPNCLDEKVERAIQWKLHSLRFQTHDLTKESPLKAIYGYCTDVMEHIPPIQVNQVLTTVLLGAQHVFFQIACEDDVCGALIGQPLHLSVHPYAWWQKKLQDLDCHIHWSRDFGTHCCFYVTAWRDGQEVVDAGILNLGESHVLKNVEANIQAGWNQVSPQEPKDSEVVIIGGGPSLDSQLTEIRELKAAGAKIVTLNGAYHWAHQHGLGPVTEIIVDARAFNARFSHPVHEGCKYLIASQCDPSVLEGLPKDSTWLWHTSADFIRPLLDEHLETWFGVPGGSTVLLRAIPLLRMLGFRQFHLFGCDSCVQDVKGNTDIRPGDAYWHHAYAQAENDTEQLVTVTCGGRIFSCQPWQVSQATEFLELIKVMGDEFDLAIYGDGLLKHILETGASLHTGD
jgi:SAM-dependent methyltransferase